MNIDQLLTNAKRRYLDRLHEVERQERIGRTMARQLKEIRTGQPPTSAAQLEARAALQLLDVQERAAEQRERNLDRLFFRLEEIHAGRLTFLAYP